MIKPSTILVLLGLCALLALGFLVLKSSRPVPKPAEPFGSRLFPDGLGDVKSIEIKKDGVTLKLDRKNKDWFMTSQKNRPAKSERVSQLLTDSATASIIGPRSGAASLFKLDEQNRITVSFIRETGKTELFVGKSSDYSKAFVRTTPDGPILEIDRSLDNSAGVKTDVDVRTLDPALFYDLKLLALNANDVIELDITKKNEVIRLQRVIPGKGPLEPKQEPPKDGPQPEWRITAPENMAAEDGAVGRATSALANLNAKGYADEIEPGKAHLDDPLAKVKVRLKDGSEHDLVFGLELDKDDIILAVDGKPELYKVNGYIYEGLAQKLEDLKKKEPVKKEAAQKAPEKKDAAAPADTEKSEDNTAPRSEPPPKSEAPPPPPPPAKKDSTPTPEPPTK